jgi:hypothetical protein
MRRRILTLPALTLAALCVMATLAATCFAATVSIGRPSVSTSPKLGVTFAASGITTSTARSGVTIVVNVQVLAPDASGKFVATRTLRARLVRRSGKPGYRYSRSVKISMTGKYGLRALRYSNGKLVTQSQISYVTVTYGRGLLAHWTFNDAAGSIAKDYVGSADGTLVGATWTTGRIGGALSFDGDDGVRVTNVLSLMTPFVTYAAWVYPTAFPNQYNEVMAFMRDAGGNRAAMVLFLGPQGNPSVELQNGGQAVVSISSPTSLPIARWSFLAVTYGGSYVKLYVNGVKRASVAYSGSIDYGSGPQELHIGADLFNFPGCFQGIIDDAAIFGRAVGM